MQLYRDDGIVLRTQKLGEADRIITILGRTSGRIRAVAKGVRRTKSRFGARLEPFTHVDLMLHTGPFAGHHHPGGGDPALRGAAGRGLSPLHGGRGDAGDGRAVHPGGEGARAAPAAAPHRRAARPRRRGARSRAWCSTPSCSARWRWPATRPPCRSAPAAAPRAVTAREAGAGCRPSRSRPGAWSAPPAARPARRRPPAPTVALMLALLRGDWDGADRSERRHRVECSGLVAAYLQWHLEHSIRSLRHVERV